MSVQHLNSNPQLVNSSNYRNISDIMAANNEFVFDFEFGRASDGALYGRFTSGNTVVQINGDTVYTHCKLPGEQPFAVIHWKQPFVDFIPLIATIDHITP